MADIASVWPWQPSELKAMTLDELSDWRERARERVEEMNRRSRRG
jgi:hypothetical protein